MEQSIPQSIEEIPEMAGKTATKKPKAAGAGRRPRERGPSRELLLDSVAALLSQRNNLEISFTEIAAHSGLNAALIKYYFGNKEGMLLALVERQASIALSGLERLMVMNLPADEKLRVHISGVINTYYRTPYLFRLLHHLLEESETAGRKITEFFVSPLIQSQRAILEQGQKEGTFRPCDPDLFYFSLTGACDHIFFASGLLRNVQGLTSVTDELRRRYIDHVTDIFLTALLVNGPKAGPGSLPSAVRPARLPKTA